MPAQPATQTSAGWTWGDGAGHARPGPPATPRAALAFGPRASTARDLAILAAVVVVLALVLRVRAQVEYAVPVSLGNVTITNTGEILTAANEAFDEMVQSQGGRVAEDAACYFYRPLGATQGSMPTDFFPAGLLPGGEDAAALDMLLCGPVELGGTMGNVPGTETPPWIPAVIYYYESGSNYRGEFQRVLPMALPILTATGGLDNEHLLTAEGRSPDQGDIEDPQWREVSGSGDAPPGGGFPTDELPPGVTLPPDVTMPTLPPDMTLPSLPSDITLPTVPGS